MTLSELERPYDPFDPGVLTDPYPHYARLRESAPAYFVEAHDFWVITRYDDVLSAARRHDIFSSADGIGIERTTMYAREVPGFEHIANAIIGLDPPDHTRVRQLISREFTPRVVAHLGSRITTLCEQMFAELVESNETGDADVASAIAYPLPSIVMTELLGIPLEQRPEFVEWADTVVAVVGGGDQGRQFAAVGAAMQLSSFFEELVAKRRSEPGDDLISLLLSTRESAAVLSDSEVIGTAMNLVIGGNETTAHLIGNAVIALASHPDELRRVCADPSLVPVAIEETLRWDSPVQGLFRTTRQPVDVAGTRIPDDARVQLLYGSANRDGSRYPDPDRFDVNRNARDHLSFSGGIHYCLGAPLARLETQIVLEHLVRHTCDLELRGEPERNLNALVRGPLRLPVSFRTR